MAQDKKPPAEEGPLEVRVRRIHRRDLNRVWEFLKLVFRDVNRETVEYQRPRTKQRFFEVYDSEGIEQLLYDVGGEIVGYSECAYEATGDDNWVNPRWFDKRGMRPLFVEELAVHPGYQGRGVGGFMLDQLQHLARTHGCTHLVLEVAENNESALTWYRARNFYKLDAAIFLAQRVQAEPDLLPPRQLKRRNSAKKETPNTGPLPEPVLVEVGPAEGAPQQPAPKKAARKKAAAKEGGALEGAPLAAPKPAARARRRSPKAPPASGE